jgi:hypothetical protein
MGTAFRSGRTGGDAEEARLAGYSHADESALGARKSVGVDGGHEESMPALSKGSDPFLRLVEGLGLLGSQWRGLRSFATLAYVA